MKTKFRSVLGRAALAGGALLLLGVAGVSVAVEREAQYVREELGGPGPARALVLYHPSRDATFSDDLSLAVARGFQEAGLGVVRATVTRDTPAHPEGYAVIAVVANTYWWTPDLPTLRYLRRARFDGTPVVGLIGGAGATGRSERMLGEALRATGGTVVGTRSFWLLRPNDETRMDEPNRGVALELARRFASEAAPSSYSHPLREK